MVKMIEELVLYKTRLLISCLLLPFLAEGELKIKKYDSLFPSNGAEWISSWGTCNQIIAHCESDMRF